MKNATLVGVVIGLLVVMIGGAVWFNNSKGAKDYSALSTRDITLLCTTDMATEFHIHPHLDILINGEIQAIPTGTGITSTCMHSIHTHDTSGTLHVESPVKRDFVLGDFFAVWDKTFTKDQILDAKADMTHKITVTVNGKVVDTYENTILRDLDKIVITSTVPS